MPVGLLAHHEPLHGPHDGADGDEVGELPWHREGHAQGTVRRAGIISTSHARLHSSAALHTFSKSMVSYESMCFLNTISMRFADDFLRSTSCRHAPPGRPRQPRVPYGGGVGMAADLQLLHDVKEGRDVDDAATGVVHHAEHEALGLRQYRQAGSTREVRCGCGYTHYCCDR